MIELILFAIAMATTVFLLICLLYMNWLINTLFSFGLQFSYEWASRYYFMSRLGFALLSIIVITSVSMVILYRRSSKLKMRSVERERAPVEMIQMLADEKEALRLELWRHKRKPSGLTGSVLLLLGIIALTSSVIYASSILAFIGLGLAFWGALLRFARPVRYVKSSLLDSTAVSALTTIDRVIADLNYKGNGIYLPPRYLKDLKEGTVFIPYEKEIITPTMEEVAQEKVFLKNPNGICLTPPGLGLANLFESELGTSFSKVDLDYLQDKLPKLFIEGLEIAEDFEMNTHGDTIHVRITESIYKDLCNEVRKLSSNVCSSLGCALCSSIACALTRATGKPVIIENTQISEDGRIIEVKYRTLGTEPSIDLASKEQTGVAPTEVSAPSKPTERHPISISPNLVGSVLTTFGSIILAWVGWLTWYDATTWGKSLALIFFGSRTGEAMSLGIGMKAIYYILIGSALVLSGSYAFFQERRRKVIIGENDVPSRHKRFGASLRFLGKVETEKGREAKERPEIHPSGLAGLILSVSGLAVLTWVGWLTWHDIAVWSKDIALIFFGSRTGEAISLGIGMKVIHYLSIGLALLLSGLLAFLRKRQLGNSAGSP